jgi:hypothetical protein
MSVPGGIADAGLQVNICQWSVVRRLVCLILQLTTD